MWLEISHSGFVVRGTSDRSGKGKKDVEKRGEGRREIERS